MTRPNHLIYNIPTNTRRHILRNASYDPINRDFEGTDTTVRPPKKKVLVYLGNDFSDSVYGSPSEKKALILKSLEEYIDEGFSVVLKVDVKNKTPIFYKVTKGRITKFSPNSSNLGTPDSYTDSDTFEEESCNLNLSDLIDESDNSKKSDIKYTPQQLSVLNKTLSQVLGNTQDDILIIGQLVKHQRQQIVDHNIPDNAKAVKSTHSFGGHFEGEVPKPFVREALSKREAAKFILAKNYTNVKNNGTEFVGEIVDGQKQRNLVKVTHADQINSHACLFIKKAKTADRLFFYINSPDDFFLDNKQLIISEDGQISFNENGNLGKFLEACKSSSAKKPPILLINWSNFSPNQRLSLNSILDPKGKINSNVTIPDNLKIISLIDAASVDESFISRHQTTLTSTLSAGDQTPGKVDLQNVENTITSSTNTDNIVKITLANCRNWKEAIYGKIVQKDGQTTWEQSDLVKSLVANNNSNNFRFTDVPADFDLHSFKQELRKIFYTRHLYFHGFEINLSADNNYHSKLNAINAIIDKPTERLDLDLPKQTIAENQYFDPDEKDRSIINSQTFETLFSKHLPENNSLKLFISSPLSDSQWLRLMAKAAEKNVELDLKLAPTIKMPARCRSDQEYLMYGSDVVSLFSLKDSHNRQAQELNQEYNKIAADSDLTADTSDAWTAYYNNGSKLENLREKFEIAEKAERDNLKKKESDFYNSRYPEIFGEDYNTLTITSPNSEEDLFNNPTKTENHHIKLNLSRTINEGTNSDNKSKKLYIKKPLKDGLKDYHWFLLLNESLKEGYTSLDIELGVGVNIPEFLKDKTTCNAQEKEARPTTASKPTTQVSTKPQVQIIVSNNTNAAVDQLQITNQDIIILGAEDILIQDLLGLPGKTEATEFQNKLAAGGKIVLKGQFSPEFLQMLEPILFDEQYKNLTLVIEDSEIKRDQPYPPLQWLGKESYQVNVSDAGTGIPQIVENTDNYNLSYEAEENSKEKSDDFLTDRKNLFIDAVAKNQMVRLMGPSGVGKSSLLKEFRNEQSDYEITDFSGDISDWAAPSKSGKKKILFIDESNIENYHFTFLSPLINPFGEKEKERQIFFKGKFHPVSKDHKVVFACNPAGFGGGRFEQKLFEGDTVQTIELKDFPTSYIYEKILKDSLYKDGVKILYPNEQDFKALCKELVEKYKLTKDEDGKPQTARKLQEDVMQLIIEEAKKKGLLMTQPENPDHKIVTATYLSTESTREIETALINSLDARNLQREGFFPKGMGLNAVIFEGQSGAGKSEMIKAVLNYKGIDVVENENPEPNQKRVCYSIKAGWDEETKKRIIIQAYKEGNAVWIDEINSCLENGLEKILNDALTGKNPDGAGTEKVKPGFMLISSINSSDLEGRSQISPALLQRSVKMDITSPKDYSKEALQAIVKQWLSEGEEEEVKKRHQYILSKLHLIGSKPNEAIWEMITNASFTDGNGSWNNCFFSEQATYSRDELRLQGLEIMVITPLLQNNDSIKDQFLNKKFIEHYSKLIANLITSEGAPPNLRTYKENLAELAPYYFHQYFKEFLKDGKSSAVSEEMPNIAKPNTNLGAGKLTIQDSLTEESYKRKSNDWIKEIIVSKTTIKTKDNDPFAEFTESQKKFLLEKNASLTAESDGTAISVMEAAKKKSGGILDVLTKSKVDPAQPDTTTNLSTEEKVEILDYAAASTLSKAIQSAVKEKEREKPNYKAEVTKDSLGFEDKKEHKFEKYADKNFVGVDLSGAFMTRFANCHFGAGCTLPTDKKSLHPKYFSNCTFDAELFNDGKNEKLKNALGLENPEGGQYKSSHKVEITLGQDRAPAPNFTPIASFKLSGTLTSTRSQQ